MATLFARLIDGFILCCEAEGKSRNTIVWYEQLLNYAQPYLPQEVDQITVNDLRRFVKGLFIRQSNYGRPYSPNTVRAFKCFKNKEQPEGWLAPS